MYKITLRNLKILKWPVSNVFSNQKQCCKSCVKVLKTKNGPLGPVHSRLGKSGWKIIGL